MRKYFPLILLLIIYYTVALTVFFQWVNTDKNNITGDEVHYLVMARGIATYHTFEQTPGYREELRSHRIMKNGLIQRDDSFHPQSADALPGPSGIFSIHNIGLPLAISIPFALWGIVGVKLFFIVISGFVPFLIWHITGLWLKRSALQALISAVCCISLPFTIAANQIYPDLIAGIISLFVVYLFFTINNKRSVLFYMLGAILLAFLPWLQIKNSLPAVLMIGYFAFLLLKNKNIHWIVFVFLLASSICSFILLLLFNVYAYGNVFGPYDSQSTAFTFTSLMTFIGLHIDQNQGFLVQNPLFFLGFVYLIPFIKKYRATALVLLLTYLGFMFPNALHTNWYGGNSFAGRFAWSGATLFVIPTLFGYTSLYKKNKKIFGIVTVASILFQMYLYVQYTFGNVDLYNREVNVWLETYSIYFHSLSRFLPSFYNPQWAFQSGVNLAYIGLFLSVLVYGFIIRKKRNIFLILVVLFVSMIIYFGSRPLSVLPPLKWTAVYFASDTGKIRRSEMVGIPQVYKSGYIINRLFINLQKGVYTLDLQYTSQANLREEVGAFELYNKSKKYSVGRITLFGSQGKETRVKMNVQIQKYAGDSYEIRAYWNGKQEIIIKSVELSKR